MSRTLEVIGATGQQQQALGQMFDEAVFTQRPTDADHPKDVTFVIVRTEADAIPAFYLLETILTATGADAQETDRCALVWVTDYLYNLCEMEGYDDQTRMAREVISMIEENPDVFIRSHGDGFQAKLQGMMSDGRVYLQSAAS